MISQIIAEKLGLDESFILRISRTASRRYKTFFILKRSGKYRTIDQPSKSLKLLQRALIKYVLNIFPVHQSVYSYREGINILDHAKCHVNSRFLIRIDFKDFFPSIKEYDIRKFLKNNINFQDERDIEFILNTLCKSKALTIGAPSSPFLSNILLFEFDHYWFEYSRQKGIIYTRYADDIYFSSDHPDTLDKHYQEFSMYVQKTNSPRLIINTKKSIYTSKKRKRMVTGLILTSENKISIGRDRKRYIKSLVWHFKNNQLTTDQIESLKGLLNFSKMIEPTFIDSLVTKYGADVIQKLYS